MITTIPDAHSLSRLTTDISQYITDDYSRMDRNQIHLSQMDPSEPKRLATLTQPQRQQIFDYFLPSISLTHNREWKDTAECGNIIALITAFIMVCSGVAAPLFLIPF